MKHLFSIDSGGGIPSVKRLCDSILSLEAETLHYAYIDAISDLKDLPDDARAALDELMKLATNSFVVEVGRSRWAKRRLKRGPSPMGIELDLTRKEHVNLLKNFGPYSINAEIYRMDETDPFFVMHDSGTSVTFFWDDNRLAELARFAEMPPSAFEELSLKRRGRS